MTAAQHGGLAASMIVPLGLHQLHYDDFLALAAVSLASLAYVTKGLLWNRPNPYQYKLYERPQQCGDAPRLVKRSKCLAERLDEAQADIAVLWASQSGTAERLAGRLTKELIRSLGAKVLLLDVSDIDPASCAKTLDSKLVIFIASTFGEGDPSDNMHDFWTWLHNETDVRLPNLRFIGFGLGNSKYKHYCHVIDVLSNQLEVRGARSLMPVGKADDAMGETEEHFLEWKEKVYELLQTQMGYQRSEVTYQPSTEISYQTSETQGHIWQGEPKSQQPRTTLSKTFELPIVQSRELFRRSAYRNCIHIEIDLGRQPQVKYKTGDYLSVWPVSPASEVNLLLEMLGLEASRIVPFTLRSLDETPLKVPTPTTLEALFQSYLDICAPISREVIRQLIAFAPDRSAGDFLEKISADKKAHAEYVSHRYTTLGRLLKAACSGTGTWNQLPLSFVVEMLPAMQPRSYSISSSSVVQARQIAITAVVADTNLIQSGERIPGLTTNYLLHASTGSHSQGLVYNAPTQAGNIHASVRKSAFKLPTLASAPIVMVGAGTGVAPFRAFVQERSRLASIGREVGTTKLFFGCRNPGEDFLYADEFEQYSRSLGDSFSLTTAFSRPTDGSQKRYVQDAIMEEAQSVVELLLERNAHFYICGSAAMARDVSEAVAKVIIAKKGWSEDQMKAFADSQKRQKRWMQDVWG